MCRCQRSTATWQWKPCWRRIRLAAVDRRLGLLLSRLTFTFKFIHNFETNICLCLSGRSGSLLVGSSRPWVSWRSMAVTWPALPGPNTGGVSNTTTQSSEPQWMQWRWVWVWNRLFFKQFFTTLLFVHCFLCVVFVLEIFAFIINHLYSSETWSNFS